MDNRQLIDHFYNCFSKGDVEGMLDCYHTKVTFEDPAFGILYNGRAFNMWRMLLSKNKDAITVTHAIIKADRDEVQAKWQATYLYGKKKRKVINNVNAHFYLKDGKVIKHIDKFNLWNWSRQALGFTGFVLGKTSFFKNKFQKKTSQMLDQFIEKSNNN